jgi:beta-1,4-mannooligosaccharide/beta-1,4-mannosyl-N-acetylglucosamine phosphorylase
MPNSLSLMPPLASTPVIHRHPANPILTAADVPYDASLVFNAGVCKYRGRYAMVFRNDYGADEAAFSAGRSFTGTNLGLAFSDDGVAWRTEPRPCITLDKARDLIASHLPDLDTERELRRFYDPRLTVLDERVYMCFAVDTAHGLRGGIAVTDDFDHWDILSLSLPDNRNMVLFPERVGGRFVRLERPMLGYYLRAKHFDAWLSDSPDLRDWGGHRLVLATERVSWCNDKLGPAAPPVKTPRGWLTTFHAVDVDPSRGKHGWERRWPKRYSAGLMLLDLHEPWRIIGLARQPLLAPEADYEVAGGFRNHVVFPGGMVLEDDGEVKIYYGAADAVECLATAHVDDLLALCEPV